MIHRKNPLWVATSIICVLGLGGCGGSSESEPTSVSEDEIAVEGEIALASEPTGELQLILTDAEEDFVTYQVNVSSIELVRRDGVQVSVLSTTTEVDFVQYQDLSELFAVTSIPQGRYESIVMQLDYTDADIVIQNEQGEGIPAAVIDTEGNPVTQLDLEIRLTGDQPIFISPQRLAAVTVDLDLAASNRIVSYEPAQVEVEPFLMVTAQLDEDREHRVRGLLETADSDANTIELNIRPMRLREGRFGQVTLNVNDETRYDIDGTSYTGSEGLTVLAGMSIDTPLVGYGQLQEEGEGYLATSIVAGSSVAWSGYDVLKGVVKAREGDQLTVGAAVIEPENGAAHYRSDISITLAETTLVTNATWGDSDIGALSVGQKIVALGDHTVNEGVTSFDATDGQIKMKLNSISGQVVSVEPLMVDLSWVNKRVETHFDFSGTGSVSEQDSDRDAYEIDTGSLPLESLEINEWVQVRGYPSPFNAGEFDFQALSVIDANLEQARAHYVVHWDDSAQAPVIINDNVIEISQANADGSLAVAGWPAHVADAMAVTTIVSSEGTGRFGIQQGGQGISIYRTYTDFVTALESLLAAGEQVEGLSANGVYNDQDQSLFSDHITVRL